VIEYTRCDGYESVRERTRQAMVITTHWSQELGAALVEATLDSVAIGPFDDGTTVDAAAGGAGEFAAAFDEASPPPCGAKSCDNKSETPC
jgi:hypothetical protein